MASGRDSRRGNVRWHDRLRRAPGARACWRGAVFVVGLLLVLAGSAMWAFSILLTLPPVYAGVWIWSTEFAWGRWLLDAVKGRARRLWSRVRAHPLRWVALTAAGACGAAATHAAVGRFDLMEKATTAVGL